MVGYQLKISYMLTGDDYQHRERRFQLQGIAIEIYHSVSVDRGKNRALTLSPLRLSRS